MRELVPYFRDIVQIISQIQPEAHLLEQPSMIERDNQFGRLSLRLRYRDGSVLSVLLWVDCSGDYPLWRHYSFHYQDNAGVLRFRYDNAPHHPELPNFPYHLHVEADGQSVFPYGPPAIREVTALVRWYLDGPSGRSQPGVS